MTKAGLVFMFLLVPACAGDAPGDDTPDDPSCAELRDAFSAAAAAVDSSCDTVADCAAVGGPREDTCNCTPALPEEAVNRDAYQGSDAADLLRRFDEQCADDPDAPSVCDAAPPDLECRNNVCVLSLNSCLDVDAGI